MADLQQIQLEVERACAALQVCFPHALAQTHTALASLTDTSCLQSANHAVHIQTPGAQASAEQALLAFQGSPQVLPASLHILEHSHSADTRFHVVLLLRQAALNAWPRLTANERTHLRDWSLAFARRLGSGAAAAHATGSNAALLRAAIALHAALLKRQWLDLRPEEQHSAIEVRHHSVSALFQADSAIKEHNKKTVCHSS